MEWIFGQLLKYRETYLKGNFQEFPCGAAETNPTRNYEVSGSIPGLA